MLEAIDGVSEIETKTFKVRLIPFNRSYYYFIEYSIPNCCIPFFRNPKKMSVVSTEFVDE